MTLGQFSSPARISEEHGLAHFDCGVTSLNDWLKKRGLENDRSGASRTYILCRGREVAGYYCLATGAVDRDEAPSALRRNMPDPVPVVVLGRLAIDLRYQGRGIGRSLLRDAVQRATQVAEIAGAVALIVHALSEDARQFYLSWGFTDWPLQPMTLYLLLRTIEQTGTPSPRN
jgi:GNAT superfamily N-acetyltransferase